MPAKRKAQTQRRSSTANRVSLSIVRDRGVDAPEIPKAPAKLLKESRDVWADLWTSPQARALDGIQAVTAVQFIRTYDLHVRLSRTASASPLLEGSQGQPVSNPLWSTVASLATELDRLKKQLGIGLRYRADLGLSEASAQLTAAQLNEMTREDHGSLEDEGQAEGEAIDAEIIEGFTEAK